MGRSLSTIKIYKRYIDRSHKVRQLSLVEFIRNIRFNRTIHVYMCRDICIFIYTDIYFIS